MPSSAAVEIEVEVVELLDALLVTENRTIKMNPKKTLNFFINFCFNDLENNFDYQKNSCATFTLMIKSNAPPHFRKFFYKIFLIRFQKNPKKFILRLFRCLLKPLDKATLLSFWYRHERGARIYDGPDEVHKVSLAKSILKGYGMG